MTITMSGSNTPGSKRQAFTGISLRKDNRCRAIVIPLTGSSKCTSKTDRPCKTCSELKIRCRRQSGGTGRRTLFDRNPYAYIDSNIVGFLNLLECVRHNPVRHFVYASSSSVYGGNTKTPFSEEDRVDNPVSLYAATKKSNELMAHVYSGLYGIPTTGLRFFTVYGPWGRPDMAPMLFAGAIREGRPIKVFNHGNLSRDFTYIDDIIEGMVRVIGKAPAPTQDRPIPAEVYNIGCGHPVQLMDFIHTLEQALGKNAQLQMMPMQQGDVYTTYADTTKLERDFGYRPQVSLAEGIAIFAQWYEKQQTTGNND